MESLQGGDFGNGFFAAGLTALTMPMVGNIDNNIGRTITGALVGGTISEATGGKFANGAVSGAIQAAMAGDQKRGFASNNPEERLDLSDVPNARLRRLMTSSDPDDRVTAAKEAANIFGISDEGITYKYNAHPNADTGNMGMDGRLLLGSRAFTSWARLGSTLGHEIEVHWQRQYVARGWDDCSEHIWVGEYEAYKYNIDNASRFGNTPQQIGWFKDGMNNAFRNISTGNQEAVLGGHYDWVVH